MAIKKVKLPNNTTEDINDPRLPAVTTTDNGKVLSVSEGIWSANSKPSYTLDEVIDGSTRKLSNYLPLTGGTIKNGSATNPFGLDTTDSEIQLSLRTGGDLQGLLFATSNSFGLQHSGTGNPSIQLIPNQSYPIFRYAATNYTMYHSGNFVAGTDYVTPTAVSDSYQPLDADLTSIAGLSGTSGV